MHQAAPNSLPHQFYVVKLVVDLFIHLAIELEYNIFLFVKYHTYTIIFTLIMWTQYPKKE